MTFSTVDRDSATPHLHEGKTSIFRQSRCRPGLLVRSPYAVKWLTFGSRHFLCSVHIHSQLSHFSDFSDLDLCVDQVGKWELGSWGLNYM